MGCALVGCECVKGGRASGAVDHSTVGRAEHSLAGSQQQGDRHSAGAPLMRPAAPPASRTHPLPPPPPGGAAACRHTPLRRGALRLARLRLGRGRCHGCGVMGAAARGQGRQGKEKGSGGAGFAARLLRAPCARRCTAAWRVCGVRCLVARLRHPPSPCAPPARQARCWAFAVSTLTAVTTACGSRRCAGISGRLLNAATVQRRSRQSPPHPTSHLPPPTHTHPHPHTPAPAPSQPAFANPPSHPRPRPNPMPPSCCAARWTRSSPAGRRLLPAAAWRCRCSARRWGTGCSWTSARACRQVGRHGPRQCCGNAWGSAAIAGRVRERMLCVPGGAHGAGAPHARELGSRTARTSCTRSLRQQRTRLPSLCEGGAWRGERRASGCTGPPLAAQRAVRRRQSGV